LDKTKTRLVNLRVAIVDNSIDPSVYTPVAHWAKYVNTPWAAFRAPEGKLPDPAEFSHFILTGSEASILEPEPWVENETAFVRAAFEAGKSILGSCYGHQLLARALAGPAHVGRCREPEVGWIPVQIRAAASFLVPAEETAQAFSLHFDEVRDLPKDRFEILASTEICPIQGFAVRGRNVRGFQIHPEIDVPEARALLAKTVETRGRGWELCARALSRTPFDSGLIFKIVNLFIAFSA
jgi:GMP synthase-like glutamine amidotransferase